MPALLFLNVPTRARLVILISLMLVAAALLWTRGQQARTSRRETGRAPFSSRLSVRDKGVITPQGNIIIVNSTADVADGTDGLCTLREAISAANTNAASGAAAGECTAGSSSGSDTVDLTGVAGAITLNTALPNLSSDITVNGPGAGSLTVQRSTAGGTPIFRIFTIDANSTVSIFGLTASNGSGGIRDDGTLILSSCTISNNQTSTGGNGGGIYVTGTLTLSNSTVSGNTTGQGAPGAAAGNGGGIFNLGTIEMVNSTVSNNQTGPGGMVTGQGGGIFNGGTLTVTNSTITGNQTASGFSNGEGGGICSLGLLSVTNSKIVNNKGSIGGGVYNPTDALPMALVGTTISGNQAQSGGGVSAAGFTTTIINCLIWHNTAVSGAGIWGLAGGDKPLRVANTTITENSSSGDGGGIHFSGTLTLTNVTITNNRSDSDGSGAETGGGISKNFGSVFLKNTIVAANFRGTGSVPDDINAGAADAGSSFNLIGTGGAGGLTNGVNNNQVGVADARLDVLADNGGLTMTHKLLSNSPALDSGDNCVTQLAHCGDANIQQLTTDQRGFSRLIDGPDADTTATVDIGAYELQPLLANLSNTSTNEDTQLLVGFDPGDTSNITSVTATSSNATLVPNDSAHLSAAITGASGDVTINPAANLNGTTDITVTVNRTGGPESKTFTLTVNPVNDAPSFTKGTDQSVNEDAGAQTVNSWATSISSGPADESGQTLTFQVTNNSNPGLFSAAPTINSLGTLIYTPAGNANGIATITINLKDSGGTANGGVDTSATQTFNITVTAVNDAPSFTKGANQTVNEDAGAQTVNNWATAISAGPANESGQALTFQVTGNTNAALFSAGPAISSTGTLTYTPAANANGSATLTINLKDNGGTANGGVDTSPSQTFTITLTSVNDPPSFTRGADQILNSNAGAQTVANWATNISAGPADESAQTVTFQITNNSNPAIFSVAPAISPNGTLTYTPAANILGTATITINLKDNGGTANGGVDTSAPQTFNITVNPAGSFISFASASSNTTESSGSVTVTVKRTGTLTQPATVDYVTSSDNGLPCATANGIATPKCDFTTALGTLSFAAGEDSKTITILITQDAFVEGPETLSISLSNPTGGPALGTPATNTITIADDATEPSTNPIDDVRNFVRQHYHDFLNREPDQSGWDFWTNQITSCGTDLQCNEVRRIDVSASFFLSIEFQQTGYLVERFYKVGYGDGTGTSTFGGQHTLPVPIVRANEFLTDTQRIGRGVVVLAPGWEQLLESNKQAYALEFVQTARFTAANAFPTTLTPAQFVDKLNLNAGNVLSASERTTAINLFSGAGDTSNTTARAQAVRQVADDADLFSAESNRAFVLAEYFGYLQRNPNDAPEPTLDYTGYDFWLTKLNQFNGNYINAEMVKAFLSSIEYRQRFGR